MTRIIPLVLACTITPVLSAQPTQPAPAAPATPLSGPAVHGAAQRVTLVVFDFTGHVRRPEVPVEQAAVALLRLDEETRAKIGAILDKRLAVLDSIIENNLDFLIALNGAAGASKAQQVDLFMKGYNRLEPLRAQGTLRSAIRAVLPADARAEFERLLNEYWDAVVAEVQSQPGEDGKKPSRLQVVIGEQFQSLGREIGYSFQRMIKSGDLFYTYIFKDLKLTDEQQPKVKQIIANFVEKYGDSSTKQQQGWLVLRIMAELDPEQRIELVKRLRKL